MKSGILPSEILSVIPSLNENIIMGHDSIHKVSNVLLENIKVNGKLWKNMSDANLLTDENTTEGIIIK